MKQNQRDAFTHLGVALAIFAVWRTSVFSGWDEWVLIIGMGALLILTLWELFSPKITSKD